MRERIRAIRRNESGFTLIELLIVIVILGVLAGVVVFAVNGISDRGVKSACKSDVKTVQVAAEAYYASNSAYAADMDALVAAGLLHSKPNSTEYTVTYTANNATTPKTVSVTGALSGGGAC